LNPFAPPKAIVLAEDVEKPGSPVRAVLLGLFVDQLSTFVFSVIYAWSIRGSGESDIGDVLKSVQIGSFPWLILLVLGYAGTAGGAFVCARIVKRNEFRWAFVMASLSYAVAALLTSHAYPIWFWFVDIPISLGSGALGAKIGRTANHRARNGLSVAHQTHG
jgi:hypothetical protein